MTNAYNISKLNIYMKTKIKLKTSQNIDVIYNIIINNTI